MDGLIYTLTQRAPEDPPHDGEKVVCLNAETGETSLGKQVQRLPFRCA